MEVSNSFKTESQEILLSQDQSRFAKKLTFFISLIILFTFIMGSIVSVFSILKHNVEAQSLSSNPTKAIRDVCYSFWYGYFEFDAASNSKVSNMGPLGSSNLCIMSITCLHRQTNYTNKINPSMIFQLSLQVSMIQIKNLQNELILQEGCKKQLNESKSQLNRSLTLMGVDPDDSILRNRELVDDMRSWLKNARVDLKSCLVGFKEKKFGSNIMGLNKVELKIKLAKEYIENSLGILSNVDNIFELFYPPIGSVLGIDFSWSSDTFLSVSLFSIPYLVLIFLFGVLLRLYRHH